MPCGAANLAPSYRSSSPSRCSARKKTIYAPKTTLFAWSSTQSKQGQIRCNFWPIFLSILEVQELRLLLRFLLGLASFARLATRELVYNSSMMKIKILNTFSYLGNISCSTSLLISTLFSTPLAYFNTLSYAANISSLTSSVEKKMYKIKKSEAD